MAKKKLFFDPKKIKMRELEDFENASGGRTLSQVMQNLEESSVLENIAFVWILRRRDEPDLTLDSIREMTMAEMAEYEVVAPEEPKRPPAVKSVG